MGRARPRRRRGERLHDEGSGKQVNIEGMLTREGQKCTCDDHVAIGHVCETHTGGAPENLEVLGPRSASWAQEEPFSAWRGARPDAAGAVVAAGAIVAAVAAGAAYVWGCP